MKKMMLAFLFGMAALFCCGQSFLLKYPNLTKRNLSEFFLDWKAYSDSIYLNNIIEDSVLADVIRYECAKHCFFTTDTQNIIVPIYRVYPKTIRVERYYSDIDTTMAKLNLGFPLYTPEMEEEQYAVDSITPILSRRELYITAGIDKILSAFVGGLKNGDKITRIQKGNVRRLREYIPVNYGHWGDYWWFTSFPMITDIFYANNLIAVARRTSWCSGDVIWYVRENNKFIRRKESVSNWIE